MRGEKNLNTPSLAVYTLSMVASGHTARRWVRAGPKMARGLAYDVPSSWKYGSSNRTG